VSGEAGSQACCAGCCARLAAAAACGGLLPPKALTQDGRATSLRMTDAGSRIGGGSSHYDALVKILLLGNSSVGKTCLLMRFCEVWHAPLRLALSPRC
jgi:hypothetical protein